AIPLSAPSFSFQITALLFSVKYKLCRLQPLRGNLKDQLLRASSSIALNLSEGHGRFPGKDQRRFYRIAFGSLRECQAILQLELEESPAIKMADSLGAHLYKLLKNSK
ncbi:MAG: four helix bundle protein, partial [Candidatus Dadabacteria bacterium]